LLAWAQWVQYALLTDANHWSAVDKLAFADILGEAAWSVTYITAHCRHLVASVL